MTPKSKNDIGSVMSMTITLVFVASFAKHALCKKQTFIKGWLFHSITEDRHYIYSHFKIRMSK